MAFAGIINLFSCDTLLRRENIVFARASMALGRTQPPRTAWRAPSVLVGTQIGLAFVLTVAAR